MSRELEPDYEMELLLPPRVEDWVSPRHVARFVREFVEQLDMESLGFRVRVKSLGRKGISSKVLLSAWLYGYMTKQKSTRSLERACCTDMGAIWLTGNLQPDHSTLWEFFNQHRAIFKAVLRDTALLACRMGLVDLGFVAIDGTKVRASASDANALSLKDLEFAVAAIDEEVELYMGEVDASGNRSCDALPERLQDRQTLKEAMKRDMEELRSLGASRLSPVDPDARTMKTKEGYKLSYNAQAAVDSKSGIVVAIDVTQDANDSSMLNTMMDEVEENIGLRADMTGADSGYFSADQIWQARQAGRAIAVSMSSREPDQPLHSWLFAHDAEQDVLVCPLGSELLFRGEATAHGGKDLVRRYHCKDHKFCPFACDCSGDKRGRVVEVGHHRDAVIELWTRQKNGPEHSAHMKKRKATVERVFGHVKRNLGLRQFEHRGIESVQGAWSIAMSATNLRTMMKSWNPKN